MTTSPGPSNSTNNPLVVSASKCLSACQHLKQIIGNNGRQSEGGDCCSSLLIGPIVRLLFNSGPSGLEKLSFPLMREQVMASSSSSSSSS